MTQNSWPALIHLQTLAEAGDLHRLSPAIYDAVSDRLEEAISSENGDLLREAALGLQSALQTVFKAAPVEVKDAMRGAMGASEPLLAAFWAGQTAFAQALAARAMDRRADDRLLGRLTHKKYEGYVRALLHGPRNGDELAHLLDERKETVSRKLKVLAALGAIERRREGNHVFNALTPTARAYLKSRNIAALASGRAAPLASAVADALEARTQDIAEHMRHTPVLGAVA